MDHVTSLLLHDGLTFLDAPMHPYKRVCPSIGQSVGPSFHRPATLSSNRNLRIQLLAIALFTSILPVKRFSATLTNDRPIDRPNDRMADVLINKWANGETNPLKEMRVHNSAIVNGTSVIRHTILQMISFVTSWLLNG